MKRLSLAFVFTCLMLMLAAQDVLKVKYEGAKPTISDFAEAILFSVSDEDSETNESLNALAQAWSLQKEGKALDAGETLNVDQKNGFILFESKFTEPEVGEYLLRIEMCYWNESDQKHKLIAFNVACYKNGINDPGQYDGLSFYRYDNASKSMEWYTDYGFEMRYAADDGSYVTYALPRSGKDITETVWHKSGKKSRTLKWNGKGFN